MQNIIIIEKNTDCFCVIISVDVIYYGMNVIFVKYLTKMQKLFISQLTAVNNDNIRSIFYSTYLKLYFSITAYMDLCTLAFQFLGQQFMLAVI